MIILTRLVNWLPVAVASDLIEAAMPRRDLVLILIDGVLAIQAGANPRMVATKLKSKMTPPGPGEVKEAA